MQRRDFLKATAALALPVTAPYVPRVRVENATPLSAVCSSMTVRRVEFYPRTNKSFVLLPDPPFNGTWEYHQSITRFHDEETGEDYHVYGQTSGWLRLEMSPQQYRKYLVDVMRALGDVTESGTIRIAIEDCSSADWLATFRYAALAEMNPWHDDEHKPYYGFVFSKLELGKGAVKCFS